MKFARICNLCQIFCHPWPIHTPGRVSEGPARELKQVNLCTFHFLEFVYDRFTPLWGVLSKGVTEFLSVSFCVTERNSVSRYVTCFVPLRGMSASVVFSDKKEFCCKLYNMFFVPPMGHVSLFVFSQTEWNSVSLCRN